MGFSDVQHDKEALPAMSVQLFTTPSIARITQERDQALTAILSAALAILDPWTQEDHMIDFSEENEVISSGRLHWIANDLTYILRADVSSAISVLPALIDLLSRVQGACTESRVTGEHVQFDSHAWLVALSLMLQFDEVLQLLPPAIVHTVWPQLRLSLFRVLVCMFSVCICLCLLPSTALSLTPRRAMSGRSCSACWKQSLRTRRWPSRPRPSPRTATRVAWRAWRSTSRLVQFRSTAQCSACLLVRTCAYLE